MRNLYRILSLVACVLFAAPVFAQSCPSGYANVTATKLGAYIPLPTGLLTVTATDASHQLINYSVPGLGVELTIPKHVPVVAGALTQTLCLPRSDRASVAVGYHFVVTDTSASGGNRKVLDAADVAITTDPWSLDDYDFRVAANPYTFTSQNVFNWRSAYSSGTTYALDDVISYNGSSYVSLQPANTGHAPDATSSTWWSLMASGGAPGGPGPTGPPGAAGSLNSAGLATVASLLNAALPQQRNLLDSARSTASLGLLNYSGATFSDVGHSLSAYIPVAGLSSIYSNADTTDQTGTGYAFFDASFTYISGGQSAAGALTVPSNATYFRTQYQTIYEATTHVVAGSSAPSSHASFGYYSPDVVDAHIASAVAPVAAVANGAASAAQVIRYVHQNKPKLTNLFDKSRVTTGFSIFTGSGGLTTDSDHSVTDYIPVVPGVPITSNTSAGLDQGSFFGYGWYDINEVWISGGSLSAPFTVTPPAGAAYYRQPLNSDALNTTMIVEGSSVPSTYIAYGYDDPATEAANIATAIVAAATSTTRLGVFGDSISALFAPYWQTAVAAKLGMTHAFNDAHAGRGTPNIFENYGGDGTGTYSGTPVGGAGGGSGNWQIGLTTGHTLAQDLAPVTLLVVWLDTNDANYYTSSNLGSAGDTPSRTGTYSALIGWVIETLQTANPAMRIVWFSPYQDDPANGHGGCSTVACGVAIKNTLIAEAALKGVTVLDMWTTSGINSKNWTTTLYDGLHPSTTGFTNFVDPAAYRFLEGYR